MKPFEKKPANPSHLPAEVREDAAETRATLRRQNHWMDEVVQDFEQKGGIHNNPYKGKTLSLEDSQGEDYYLYKFLKNANVLPYWIELQLKIRNGIAELLKRMDGMEPATQKEADKEIKTINKWIREYNRQCPAPFLQRMTLTRENLREQSKKWE